jgi:hypothetical protein
MPTPDGAALVCERLLPVTKDSQSSFGGVILLDVATGHVTDLRGVSASERTAYLMGASASATHIVWGEHLGDPNNLSAVDWVIYSYDRKTHRTHVVSRAAPADVIAGVAFPRFQPVLANNRVWWAAVVLRKDGTPCVCVYSAPAAGGPVSAVAQGAIDPQPVDGNGTGPFHTTLYARTPDPAGKQAVVSRITADGQPVSVTGAGEPVSAVAAGPLGVAWQRDIQQVVVSFARDETVPSRVIGSLPTQGAGHGVLGADRLQAGDRFVVWSQSNGGRAYDTGTNTLYITTTYDFPAVAVRGPALMWGDAPKGSAGTPAVTYHVLLP